MKTPDWNKSDIVLSTKGHARRINNKVNVPMLDRLYPVVSLFALAACAEATQENTFAPGDVRLSEQGYELHPVTTNLEFPWQMQVLDTGTILVTEREGRLRRITDGQLVDLPLTGLPDDIRVDGQGGLLGLAIDPDFNQSRKIYLSYAKNIDPLSALAVIRATLSEDEGSISDASEIFLGEPRDTTHHFGGRLGFLPDRSLIITLGDGLRYMDAAQDLTSLHGKIVRINTDGTIPADNPLIGEGSRPEIFSFGHRNVQGLVFDAERQILFAHEHGPKGGDELNIIDPGNNYGWPEITYGINYDGTFISTETHADGMQQPIHKWVPSIAPSGMTLVNTAAFPEWRGDLLIGAMNGPKGRKLVRIDLNDAGSIIATEDLLGDLQLAFRDVLSTPEDIFLATADFDGAIYRIEHAD